MPNARTLKRCIIACAWLFTIGGIVAAAIRGVPRLEAYAIEHHTRSPIEVHFTNEPAWVNDDLRRTLHTTATAQLQGSIIDRTDLVYVRNALLDTGWFQEIRQVRRAPGRHNGNRIIIDAEFATPHALVRDRRENLDYLIDVKGRLLPYAFAAGSAAVNYPVIVGASRPRPVSTGEIWPGADIAAALALLREITGPPKQPWLSQIAAIDVSAYTHRQRLTLITDRDCRIIWGRAPGDVSTGEVTTAEKLAYLKLLYEADGRLDMGCAGAELIIYGSTTNRR